jgi:hypothetical protein
MVELAKACFVAARVEQQRPKAKTTLAFPTPSVFRQKNSSTHKVPVTISISEAGGMRLLPNRLIRLNLTCCCSLSLLTSWLLLLLLTSLVLQDRVSIRQHAAVLPNSSVQETGKTCTATATTAKATAAATSAAVAVVSAIMADAGAGMSVSPAAVASV